jgi:hypothetical protein
MTCFAPSVCALGLFTPAAKQSKTSRFESKDRSSDDLATEYFRS